MLVAGVARIGAVMVIRGVNCAWRFTAEGDDITLSGGTHECMDHERPPSWIQLSIRRRRHDDACDRSCGRGDLKYARRYLDEDGLSQLNPQQQEELTWPNE